MDTQASAASVKAAKHAGALAMRERAARLCETRLGQSRPTNQAAALLLDVLRAVAAEIRRLPPAEDEP